ncbi:uncharacterized protein [Coffea arabica]|uniref:Uncharacterized protein isoform X1 n=2 Tax=Coffea arabica TaxID=13443 RepID=A0ABM4V627_COFAR
MGSTFNPQILVEKLAKLNISQQSIETLSHWCIFHMNKAKQVVETWDRQFHCSPREQRLAYLYLANDILQNSRRKGSEFVGEFWKVLPDALRDVIENGDESGRTAAVRLVSIWEERKVFGSRGQILKEEFVGRQVDNANRNLKHTGSKLQRHAAGDALDRIVSSYQLVYSSQLDEDSVINKCRSAINCIQKADKEIGGDLRSGPVDGSGIVDELKGQHATLRDCIGLLTSIESSRANLMAHLREALQEEEYKLDQVRNQLQAARVHSEQAGNKCGQLLSCDNNEQVLAEQDRPENHLSQGTHDFDSGSKEQSAPVMYSQQVSFTEKSSHLEEDTKSAAAAVAAKLTASSSSAQMLTFVLSSLASEGVIGNPVKESPSDYPSEKRPKLENDRSSYVPLQNSEAFQQNIPVFSQDVTSNEQPPPPSSPPPLPPLPPMQPYPVPQYMSSAGTIASVPFGYSTIQQQQVAVPGYSPTFPVNGVAPFAAAPTNTYQSYPTEGGFYGQQPSLPMAPVSRQ